MSLFDKLKEMAASRSERKREERLIEMQLPERDAWETRDKSLIALRRLKRKQLDEVERAELSRSISEFNHQRDSKGFFGESLFDKSKSKKSREMRFLGGSSGFLGRGRL